MTAPHLNRKLLLEAPQQIADGAGGYTTSWIALGTLWAEIRPRSGREREAESFPQATVPYHVIVRAAPDGAPSRPKPEQRFRLGSRIFQIRAVGEYGSDGRYLTCFAKEEVAQ
ncbi:MAG: phage head closure protein [Maritimibacter sp.]